MSVLVLFAIVANYPTVFSVIFQEKVCAIRAQLDTILILSINIVLIVITILMLLFAKNVTGKVIVLHVIGDIALAWTVHLNKASVYYVILLIVLHVTSSQEIVFNASQDSFYKMVSVFLALDYVKNVGFQRLTAQFVISNYH